MHGRVLIVPIGKARLAETTFRRSPCNWQSAILEPRKKSDFDSNARVSCARAAQVDRLQLQDLVQQPDGPA